MPQEITSSYQCHNGDVIEFHYSVIGVYEQSQVSAIIDKINADPRMLVKSYVVNPSTWASDELVLQVVISENPFPLLLLILVIGAVATSIFLYLSLGKIYLIESTATPEGTAAIKAATGGTVGSVTSTISLGILAIIGVIAFLIIGKFKP